MVYTLRAWKKLEGAFDMDAERAYVDGVWAGVQGREVAESSGDLLGTDRRIHFELIVTCHV
jgi:hypothetical protein